jgi:YHS domain-containing protein
MNKKLLGIALIVVMLGLVGLLNAADEKVRCAVTGEEMNKADAKISTVYQGTTYYFCCAGCKDKFTKAPEGFLKTVYTCPMHADVVADKAGKCPTCGMNLTAKKVPIYGHKGDGCDGCEGEKSAGAEKKADCCQGKDGKAKAAVTSVYQGTTYTLCCQECKTKFDKDPEKMLKTVYTCPMHADVVSDKAGKCPTCGMNLTAKKVLAHDPKQECCKDCKKADCCKDGKAGCAGKKTEHTTH